MTRGRNICNQLKAVRRSIAEENGIPLEIKECSYKGECRGTCPQCEAEVRYLENAIADRLRLGKAASIAGLTLGLAACGGGMTEGEVPNDDTMSNTPETDTVNTADTAKSVWREPPDMTDVYLGGIDVLDINDTAILEEGEAPDDDLTLAGVIYAEDPEFPGGPEARNKFITDNLKYPTLALENGISGRVYVQFEVDTDGSIRNVRVVRDIGGGCGAEARRVVEMMPKWIPGKQRGKTVCSVFTLPINFILPEDRPHINEGMAPIETFYRCMEADSVSGPHVGPNAPTQQMEIEGVKVIVR